MIRTGAGEGRVAGALTAAGTGNGGSGGGGGGLSHLPRRRRRLRVMASPAARHETVPEQRRRQMRGARRSGILPR